MMHKVSWANALLKSDHVELMRILQIFQYQCPTEKWSNSDFSPKLLSKMISIANDNEYVVHYCDNDKDDDNVDKNDVMRW